VCDEPAEPESRAARRIVASGVASARGGKGGTRPRICDECLALCEEILAQPALP
jgi:hypothetical protein